MKENKVVTYFENLGKLFYAIAVSDKKIELEEIEILNQYIEEFWTDCDALEGIAATDPAYQIIITFEKLQEQQTSSTIAYKAFENYYNQNKSFFTNSAKHTILLTAEAIAKAFIGKNKTELGMLTKLKLLLKN
jgi:hypothetical protein